MHSLVDDFFIWNHLGPKIYVLRLMILIFIFFLNVSNDLRRRNDINQSCSTGRCMQLYSWWLCHLNSFRTQNLCFKINDFAIHIFFTFPNDFGGRNDLHQSCNWSDLKLFNSNFFYLSSFRISNMHYNVR